MVDQRFWSRETWLHTYWANKKVEMCRRAPTTHGVSLAYIRDQLSHHSIKMTVDVYGHLMPGADQAAVNRLDEMAPNGTPVASKQKKGVSQIG